MKTEHEIKNLYAQYLLRYGNMKDHFNPDLDKISDRDIANQLLGAAFAYGRMLGLGMTRIRLDVKKAIRELDETPTTKDNLFKLL